MCAWEDKIKLDCEETGCDNVDWIYLKSTAFYVVQFGYRPMFWRNIWPPSSGSKCKASNKLVERGGKLQFRRE
jgi:hypothetical protein